MKRPPPVAGVTLNEFQPWLTTRHEPGAAQGVIYFMRGHTGGRTENDFHALHFFLGTLSQRGWNIIGAQAPYGVHYRPPDNGRVGAYVAERSRQLRREGYKRVVVGGHSRGAWYTLMAEAQAKLDADALLLLVPASFGERTREDGRPNPFFLKNRSEFIPLIRAVRKPTALFLFEGDTFDPGGRGVIAAEQFQRRKLSSLLVSSPSGFKSHYAAVPPTFDFAYSACIDSFFVSLQTRTCHSPEFDPADFRSSIDLDRIDEAKVELVEGAGAFSGRSFVVYTLGGGIREVTFTSSTSASIRTARERSQSPWTLKGGQLCLGSDCEIIRRWDERHYLAFDPNSRIISSWWIMK
jgi:pimeloyl-ACP methyl ester carboxylesterase